MPDRALVAVEERTPAATPPAAPADRTRIGFGPFALIAIQLLLVLAVPVLYQVELERGFAVVAIVMFVGFLVHAWLPVAWRVPFFVLITMTAAGFLLQADALWLIALGLGLVGLCHLPVPWGIRVALVAAAGAALAAVLAGWIPAPWGEDVIPILGAMFMFRVILYLYDLKTDRSPATPWQRVAYFFMLPNICFPLFPIVDYKTFLRTRYDAPAAQIYQKGVFWMMRGVTHLLLYRIVYYLLPRADAMPGILGVVVFMAMMYGLYLRVSGLYHIIVGSLCLFGFNLPPANHNYYLASGFNDLWRRANIYWKDFMMTTVFNPVVVGVRRFKVDTRILIGTIVVAILTWFLHSYQWFWLLGRFPLTLTDALFWGALGMGLILNTVWQARKGRTRRLGRPSFSWGAALKLTLRTMGTFFAIAFLWLLWDTGSVTDWGYRLLQTRESSPKVVLVLAALIGAVIAGGVFAQWLASKGWGWEQLQKWAWRRSSLLVPAVCAPLLVLGLPSVHLRIGGKVERLVVLAASTEPNKLDRDRAERGYYETLSRSIQVGGQLDIGNRFLPGNWEGFSDSDAAQPTDDIRGFEIIPNVETYFKTVPFHANRWGMRDRDYEREKPAGTYRAAVIGGSREMGSGVADGEAYESVLEERWNRELTGRGYERYEFLNFGVGGYSLLQTLYVVQNLVPPFQPDLVLIAVYPDDRNRTVDRLHMTVSRGEDVSVVPPFARELMTRARVSPNMPIREFHRRLEPYKLDLITEGYRQKIEAVRGAGAVPVFVLMGFQGRGFSREGRERLTSTLEGLGAVVVYLDQHVYDGYDPEDLQVAPWDTHPNAQGHRLIGAALHEALMQHADEIGLGGVRDTTP